MAQRRPPATTYRLTYEAADRDTEAPVSNRRRASGFIVMTRRVLVVVGCLAVLIVALLLREPKNDPASNSRNGER